VRAGGSRGDELQWSTGLRHFPRMRVADRSRRGQAKVQACHHSTLADRPIRFREHLSSTRPRNGMLRDLRDSRSLSRAIAATRVLHSTVNCKMTNPIPRVAGGCGPRPLAIQPRGRQYIGSLPCLHLFPYPSRLARSRSIEPLDSASLDLCCYRFWHTPWPPSFPAPSVNTANTSPPNIPT
jgi:hypothetical protein